MLDKLNQSYFSPYFIFIKEGFNLLDKDILLRLGLDEYQLVTDEKERNKEILSKRYLFLTEDTNWTCLMDDWLGGMWFNKEIRSRKKILSKDFEIYTCGIQDYGFDFAYFKDGEIRRQYVVDNRKIIVDIGSPLAIESIALQKKDPYDKVIAIAEFLGIKLNYEKEKVRIYGRQENEMEMNFFNDDEY